MTDRLMRIGQISKQVGISIYTIRFYERAKLLRAPARTSGGFRVYSADDVSALRFIRNLQTLGFSLTEIREFSSLRANDLRTCSEVRGRLDHKLKAIHAKRIALGKLENELKAAMAKCNLSLRHRPKKDDRCPVLVKFKEIATKGAG